MTPMHFIQFFIAQGIVFTEDLHKNSKKVDLNVAKYVRKYSEFFGDLSLLNYEFRQYPSVILSCACIAGARKTVGIVPT